MRQVFRPSLVLTGNLQLHSGPFAAVRLRDLRDDQIVIEIVPLNGQRAVYDARRDIAS
jgi:hypothetical protein